MIAAALVLWRRGWPVAAGLLLGGRDLLEAVQPVARAAARPRAAPRLARAGGRAGVRGLARAPAGGGAADRGRRPGARSRCSARTSLVTGELNYQGGERKTFYGSFPFERKGDRDYTFGNTGITMSTNTVGPKVEGQDAPERGAEPPRSGSELRASFLRSLWTFWIGRFGGALPYFLAGRGRRRAVPGRRPARPLRLAGRGRRSSVSYLFYIWMIPDNWYGGSGTVGNRYFLNLLPLAIFLVPRGRAPWVAAAGLVGAAVFTGPILRGAAHALAPARDTTRSRRRSARCRPSWRC